MSQLLVIVFVTSDQHNLLISDNVCAVAKLGVSPTAMGKCETVILSRGLITGLISPSENETEVQARKTTHAHICTLNSALNHPAVHLKYIC